MKKQLKIIPLEERIVLDASCAAVLYVNANVNTHAHGYVANGSSWADAYSDLQSALNAVKAGTPTQVWIAEGTYAPNQVSDIVNPVGYTVADLNSPQVYPASSGYAAPQGIGNGFSVTNLYSFETFNLNPHNYTNETVSLYGGFNGTERSLSQRNPSLYVTTLNGDVQDGEQAWHVVTALNVTATLDGLTVENGNAAGPDAPDFTTLYDSGGGLYSQYSHITLNNDIFKNDSAANAPLGLFFNTGYIYYPSGGAVFIAGENATLTVTNSEFVNDNATEGILTPDNSFNGPVGEGGAIAAWGGNSATAMFGVSVSISNSQFVDDNAWFGGGAILMGSSFQGQEISSLTINQSTFVNDSSIMPTNSPTPFGIGWGGAVSIDMSSASISNSTFLDNSFAAGEGGAIGVINFINTEGRPMGPEADLAVSINNDTFIDNSAGIGGAISFLSGDGNANVFIPFTIQKSEFIGNSAQMGGAIFTDTTELTINNSIFIGNSATDGNGGAIATTNNNGFSYPFPSSTPTTTTVTNSTFIGNSAEGSLQYLVGVNTNENVYENYISFFAPTNIYGGGGGGAIANFGDGILSVNNSFFVGNRTNHNGGAIENGGFYNTFPTDPTNTPFLNSGITTVSDSSFVGNLAKNGGAISSDYLPDGSGGDGYVNDLAVTVTNSIMSLNLASKDGGAIYLDQSSATITGNAILGNDAGGLGDQIYADSSTINGDSTSTSAGQAAIRYSLRNQLLSLDTENLYLA